ncbi:hypothetical protein C0W92_10780 [Photobacterium angustum]|uniref:Exonuclease domain-containing protein n=1 Tax=Photobacterium angustum TaxID=661 RepID=A0A855SHH5_PHOAN|nr:hypothetical protein [Photobacterium angustum]KJF81998.1 hypothetical protein UB36_09930 [Photobacterium damselae subsp. damselae]KJG02731.1 hypothetical protein UB35_07875 [Photobacterium angustum]KJG18408.1 hypothetical protein UA33_06135 [Photobacterium angustum]KJG20850.1 hypothetical protein UA39_18820 [Photobacterium angustum]KJG29281.1 hypothetical protein UA36_15750 [Photobacterium angustum]
MWAILDFEASGLSEHSYPIEVGYSLPDGTNNSMLINPLSASDNWSHWDKDVQHNIHKISRSMIEETGMQVMDVCQHLNMTLGQYDLVLCDSEWDLFWLGRLYHAAHMRPSFVLTEVSHWLKHQKGLGQVQFKLALDNLGAMRHQAGYDAKQIRLAIDTLVKPS